MCLGDLAEGKVIQCDLLETVRTGRCAATTFYGQPFFAWLGSHPEHVQRFRRAMANLTDRIKLGAISSCDFTDAGRIVDVGGADGTVLAHILAATPGAIGTAFDLPPWWPTPNPAWPPTGWATA